MREKLCKSFTCFTNSFINLFVVIVGRVSGVVLSGRLLMKKDILRQVTLMGELLYGKQHFSPFTFFNFKVCGGKKGVKKKRFVKSLEKSKADN